MRSTLAILCVGLAAGAAWSQGKELECRIASVGMFKNGLAVITRTVEVPRPGVYIVTNPPEPIHGTFWLESDAVVEARMTTRELDVPVTEAGGPGLQEEWVGARVALYFRDGAIPPTSGTVLEAGSVGKHLGRQLPGAESLQHPFCHITPSIETSRTSPPRGFWCCKRSAAAYTRIRR